MDKLAKLRKKEGLTQEQLAEKVGLSTSSIAMYETGDRKPPLEKAKVLADFFGVSIEDIFFNSKPHECVVNENVSA
ncbi:putative transcriptional regulator [Halanaerobium congolense]|uniref:Putative transcriptional regulator n=1 Tax=Halanaerobium congolense TaxID=54121 RepID=A0A1G8PY16_9FIRM|nr:helix-turn-helix transcriptional regulator [Halanaerobium congolense]SDI97146.1 putative transcriptional regulator [Halanaerobium congolense]SES92041.1 putative transcriptional regulator [Halanaerobium congolense]